MAVGATGFDRLTSADSPTSGEWIAIKAINSDVIFDAGCNCFEHDAPAEDDVLREGDVLFGRFLTVAIKAGGEAFLYRASDSFINT